jgi:ABC-type lipoprotein export system ATPase subunit/GNAT superfamily N-acetyltransferase
VKATIVHESQVRKTGRVLQMAGMFDLPLEEKTRLTISADLPIDVRPWSIGLIVGPSGSGKSSIAKHLWPTRIVTEQSWSHAGALIDDFPAGMSITDVVGLLTAVGLGSPPAWVRPYGTLSNGEAFRAQMARALAETDDLIVVDEFTSVVDRQVAKVASHAVQKTVRKRGQQLIAVTCHYDVEDWLQPDWSYDVSTSEFTWRSVQPHPQVNLEIYPIDRSPWPMFARHHYLSGDLHVASQCFGGWIGSQLAAFTAYRHFPHANTRNIKIEHRTVVLPDYQGLGISGRLAEWIGQRLWDQGFRYKRSIAHPAIIHHCSRSPRWVEKTGGKSERTNKAARRKRLSGHSLIPRQLGTRSFEYRAPRSEE